MRRILGRLLRAFWFACAALGLLFLLVTFTPATGIWAKALTGPWQEPQGDILIVLGGSAMQHATMGQSSYFRAWYAVYFDKRVGYRQIYLSGGPAEGGPPLAHAMRDYLVANGIPPEKIVVEERAQSTRENAVFLAELLRDQPGTKILLTSDYHVWRAARAFRKAGIEVVPQAAPDANQRSAGWRERWPLFLDLASESTKIIYYKLRGWI